MLVVVFGASGRTGKEVLGAARAQGIEVRPFDQRSPSVETLRQVLRGVQGVVIVFGPKPPYKDCFCARETRDVIEAMAIEGVTRLICQTGAMIGNYPRNRSLAFALFSLSFQKNNPSGYMDRVGQEDLVKNSSLEWTIVKPPRLTDGKSSQAPNAGKEIKVGILSSISRKSLANFIVSELVNPRHIHEAVFVKN